MVCTGWSAKQFLRRERVSLVAGETQYAFVHVLMRDVAKGRSPVLGGRQAERHDPGHDGNAREKPVARA